MTPHEELFSIAEKLKALVERSKAKEIQEPLEKLRSAAKEVGRSFSGSWQGYHSRVYYAGFKEPPPGAHFSQEWGLMNEYMLGKRSLGDWEEMSADEVTRHIESIAGHASLDVSREVGLEATDLFESSKSEILSILQNELDEGPDTFLAKLKEQLERARSVSATEIADRYSPKGTILTRDTIVLGQGTQVPPHMLFVARTESISNAFEICATASAIATKAGSHIERRLRKRRATSRVGTNVFIGHGRSLLWRELKDFVQDRLGLPWDEFNRVPVAGVTNIARLSEMLDAAAVAFLVMTAEDEMQDGITQPRMNVVHEAGLFQGRLGFTRAVVLLEEGCQEFSNIQGLGQIRFPNGRIAACFEEVRQVLEREGLISERT